MLPVGQCDLYFTVQWLHYSFVGKARFKWHMLPCDSSYYAPNFEEVRGAYCFWGVRPFVLLSRFLMHAISYEPYKISVRPLLKYFWARFHLPSLLGKRIKHMNKQYDGLTVYWICPKFSIPRATSYSVNSQATVNKELKNFSPLYTHSYEPRNLTNKYVVVAIYIASTNS